MPGVEYKTTHPKTRKQWRKWLQKNHSTSPGTWLIYYKKGTGKRKFHYPDAAEEALCFGWIGSAPGKSDEERAMLKFTPRKSKSMWIKLNKQKIENLTEQNYGSLPVLLKLKRQKKMGAGIL